MMSDEVIEEKLTQDLWKLTNESNLEEYVTKPASIYHEVLEKSQTYKDHVKELSEEINRLNGEITKMDEKYANTARNQTNDITSRAYSELVNTKKELESKKNKLKEVYRPIITEFVDELRPLLKLKDVKDSKEITGYDDSWVSKEVDRILNSGYRQYYEEKRAKNLLEKHSIFNTYNTLKEELEQSRLDAEKSGDPKKVGYEGKIKTLNAIKDNFSELLKSENKVLRKDAIEAIGSIDIDSIKTDAGTKLSNEKTEKKTRFDEELKKYTENVKKIDKYTKETPRKNLNGEVAAVSLEIGNAKLRGDKTDAILKRTPYQKIRDAAIAMELSDITDWDFNSEQLKKQFQEGIETDEILTLSELNSRDVTSGTFNFQDAYEKIKAGTFWSAKKHQYVHLKEKDKRAYIKELADIADNVTDRVDSWLPKFLEKYFYVLAGSKKYDATGFTSKNQAYLRLNEKRQFDETLSWDNGDSVYIPLSTLNDWYVGKKRPKKVGPSTFTKMKHRGWKAAKSAIEYTPEFLKDGVKKISNYAPNFLKKMGGFVKNKLPKEPDPEELKIRDVDVIMPEVDTDALIYRMLQNHKASAWGTIHPITDDMLVKATGGKFSKKYLADISTAWDGIESLSENSDIQEIIDKYTFAAEVTEKVNYGVKKWTTVINDEFKFWDDELNRRAGFFYYAADKATEIVNKLFKSENLSTKIETPAEITEKYYKWDINDRTTMIEPPTLAPLVTGAAIVGGLAALGVIAYNALTPKKAEKISEEKKGILRPGEVAKELLFDVASFLTLSKLTRHKATA